MGRGSRAPACLQPDYVFPENGIRPSIPDVRQRVERRPLERLVLEGIRNSVLTQLGGRVLDIEQLLAIFPSFCQKAYGYSVAWPRDPDSNVVSGYNRFMNGLAGSNPDESPLLASEKSRQEAGIRDRLGRLAQRTSTCFTRDAGDVLFRVGFPQNARVLPELIRGQHDSKKVPEGYHHVSSLPPHGSYTPDYFFMARESNGASGRKPGWVVQRGGGRNVVSPDFHC